MPQPAPTFSILLSQLTDPDSQKRLQAIKNIMRLPEERGQALANLLVLLTDPDEQVCKAAITALGKLGNRQAVPAIGRVATGHPQVRLRLLALKVLAQIDRAQAT